MQKHYIRVISLVATLIVLICSLSTSNIFAQNVFHVHLPLLRTSSPVIAFSGIRLSDQNGERIQSVTSPLGVQGFSPSWSPDGTQLVFAGYPLSTTTGLHLYIINVDSTGLRQLTKGAFVDSEPSWSPDGAEIAFHSNRDGVNNIYTIQVDGTGLRQLTTEAVKAENPSWSADGELIAFTRYRSEFEREIVIMKRDGSEKRLLPVPEEWNCREPGWSPIGARLAYVCLDPVTIQYLLISNANGTGVVPVIIDNSIGFLRRVGIHNPDWRQSIHIYCRFWLG